jgi:ribosomal-protein-alanine N-acetyltransferase
MEILTARLKVILQTPEEVEQMIAAMPEQDRSQISPVWLARMRSTKVADPFVHAFRLVERNTGAIVGSCSFKGPPVDSIVEIAYSIEPEYQGKGYATEAARALAEIAATREDVRLVRAHTLPDGAASKRVLAKCGFDYVGETVDPEDGTVSRFELAVARERDPDGVVTR